MLRWLLGNGLAKDVCFSWKLLHGVPCHHLGEGRTTRSMLSLTQKWGADEWSPDLLQSQQQLTHFKETPLWALLCLGTTRHALLHRSTFTEYRQLGVTHLLYFRSMYWRLALSKKSPSYFFFLKSEIEKLIDLKVNAGVVYRCVLWLQKLEYLSERCVFQSTRCMDACKMFHGCFWRS